MTDVLPIYSRRQLDDHRYSYTNDDGNIEIAGSKILYTHVAWFKISDGRLLSRYCETEQTAAKATKPIRHCERVGYTVIRES